MSTYSQSKLTNALFSSGESRGGGTEKLGSTSNLDFSKRGLKTSS